MALQPDYLQGLPAELEKLTEQLEKELIEDISRRIAKAGEITDTAAYQLLRLKELGASSDYLEKLIADYTQLSGQQVRQMIFDAAQVDSEFYEEFYRRIGQPYTPYEYNDYLQQLTKAAVNQTCGELKNYTRSMGFSVRGADGRMQFKPAAKAYQSAMDKAFMLAASGGVDYITAVRRATAEITGSGLMFVDYASGVRTHADVAARRALLTGISQMTGQIAESNAAKLGTDVVEVTAHAGARPDHAAWQGKWFSLNGLDKRYPKLRDITGYGTVTGLKGANCRHDFYPVIPGIDEPAYTAEQLANIDPPPVTIGGKTYTYYEAEQRQREMERAIRKTKREIIAAEASGDNDQFTAKSVLLRRQREQYSEFSKAAGLLTRNERTQVAEFGRSAGSKSSWAARKAKASSKNSLTSGGKGGMINRRQLAQATEFNIKKYNIVEDLPSVEILKKYATETMGFQYISGIENLKNGYNAQIILSTVQELSETYNKHFSRISFVDFGNEKTIAETLGSELRLNFEFMNSPDAVEAVLNEWLKTGYIPKGCNNCVYVAKHEYFHLLTQDLIDEPQSKIVTTVNRSLSKGCDEISVNGRKNCHEFVADLLSAKSLTKKQKQLKQLILTQIN